MNVRGTFYFAGVAVFLAGLVVVVLRLFPPGESAVESVAPESTGESVVSQYPSVSRLSSLPDTGTVVQVSGQRAVNSSMEDNPLFSAAFRKTRLAATWRSRGVTDKDIRNAVEQMRLEGFRGAQLSDAALVGPFLPAKNIEPVAGKEVLMAETAAPGEPVSFLLKAVFPDPSYSFERWEISRDGNRIIVQPVGHKAIGPSPAVVVPVELSGALPGLDAGHYTVIFGSMSHSIEKNLTVR